MEVNLLNAFPVITVHTVWWQNVHPSRAVPSNSSNAST